MESEISVEPMSLLFLLCIPVLHCKFGQTSKFIAVSV